MDTTAVGKKVIRFQNNLHEEFAKTLNKRVNSYFKQESRGRYANAEMIIKTIFMFSLYMVPYFMYVLGYVQNAWLFLLMTVLMGLGKAGIGLSVMHDANHGAYSRKKWVNELIGYSMNFIGGNATNWKIQHNIKHHTYTNVSGIDEDFVDVMGLEVIAGRNFSSEIAHDDDNLLLNESAMRQAGFENPRRSGPG